MLKDGYLMVNVIIGILVVVAVIYFAVVMYQHHLLKIAEGIEGRVKRLNDLNLQNEINKVKDIGLTGDSLSSVNSAQADFNNVTNNLIPTIKQNVEAVKSDSKGVNFVKTRDECSEAEQSVNTAEDDVKVIRQFLAKMNQLNSEHKKAITDLEARYKDLRKKLLTKNASFGPAIDALENQLSTIEGTFDDFSSLSKNGDHEKADKILGDLNKSTDQLELDVKKIPHIFATNNVEFKNQIEEISSTHAKMNASGYEFADDEFDVSLEELRSAVSDNLKNIAHLDLKLAEDSDNEIETKIDRLYDLMEKQLVAKKKVDKNFKITGEYIQHAKKQNQILISELDRLSHNYSLEHGEIDNANALGKQIDEIEDTYKKDRDAINNKEAIYTRILEHITSSDSQLNEIEKKQRLINDSVADFKDEEQKAHQVLDDLDLELHGIQRKIDELNLPGISQDYVDYFGIVADEIKDLNRTMDKVKISMDDVQKQLSVIKSDRDTLEEKTDDLIDSSSLAEQVMQYANRYRNSNPEISSALSKAKHLFDDEYKYPESLETIATAIDKANPGSYKRIENAYYKNKQDSQNQK